MSCSPTRAARLQGLARAEREDSTECARSDAHVLPEVFGPTNIVRGAILNVPLEIGPKFATLISSGTPVAPYARPALWAMRRGRVPRSY